MSKLSHNNIVRALKELFREMVRDMGDGFEAEHKNNYPNYVYKPKEKPVPKECPCKSLG